MKRIITYGTFDYLQHGHIRLLERAKALGISRPTYENKKKTGKFTASEAAALCKLFDVSFDYLFSTDQAH